MFKRSVVSSLLMLSFLFGGEKDQTLVPYVDLDRFMGEWYVIANIPTRWEIGAHNAIENYSWNEDGYVDVLFSYHLDAPDGEYKEMTQKGFIYDTKSNAAWRIQPVWPLKLGYFIIDLADDYSYTVIGVPSRKYLWIMAREPSLPDDVYGQILKRVKEQGYDLNLIQEVPQVW